MVCSAALAAAARPPAQRIRVVDGLAMRGNCRIEFGRAAWHRPRSRGHAGPQLGKPGPQRLDVIVTEQSVARGPQAVPVGSKLTSPFVGGAGRSNAGHADAFQQRGEVLARGVEQGLRVGGGLPRDDPHRQQIRYLDGGGRAGNDRMGGPRDEFDRFARDPHRDVGGRCDFHSRRG